MTKAEETYRNLYQNAQVGLFRTKIEDGTILESNKQLAKMFGFKDQKEFVRKYKTSDNYVDPGTREQMLKKVKDKGEIKNFEARFYRKDGSIFWALYSARIYPEKNWIEGVAEDITNRKKAEEALIATNQQLAASEQQLKAANQQLRASEQEVRNERDKLQTLMEGLSATKIGMDIVGIDYIIHSQNSVLKERFGDITGKLCYKEYMDKDEPCGFCPMQKAIKNNRAERIELTGRDGRDYELISAPLYSYNGKIDKMVEIVKDITIQKQQEREIIKAKEKAEESDRLKSAFLANMSHEIRTPMNGIFGFINLLKQPKLTGSEREKYIEIIKTSGDRLMNTVNDLIDISKIETGQVDITFSEINIKHQVEELNRFFEPEAKKNGIKLVLEKSLPSEKSNIKTDKTKLNSILTNLLKNAIKYTEEGSVAFGYEKNKKYLTFYVKDTGIGIPENRQEAIFNRFVQADIGDTRAFEGSGLGLAISKSYVEMLGGKIWVESEEGKGSTFYFTIPYQISEKETETNKDPETIKNEGNKVKNLKILIAEDEETADMHLSIVLKRISKEILHAKTGVETVDLCKKNKDIDLVLMDIRMPEMDGYEATRKIREFNKDIIIIAQTAYALSGDREKALEAGCDDYISKPIKKEDLFFIIGKYFG